MTLQRASQTFFPLLKSFFEEPICDAEMPLFSSFRVGFNRYFAYMSNFPSETYLDSGCIRAHALGLVG